MCDPIDGRIQLKQVVKNPLRKGRGSGPKPTP